MNLFLRELKAHRKSMLIWSFVLAIFMYLSMAKFSALSTDAAASQQLMQALPTTMQAIFGMVGLDLTTIAGYYGICFIFIAVMLAIHAGMLGAELIAKEEVDKTAEFLYVKPISRARALTIKLAAGLLILVVLFAVTWLSTYSSIAMVNSGNVPVKELGIFSQALAIMQLLFFALGVLCAAGLRQPKRAATIIAGAVLVAYIAYVLQGLSSDFSWAKALSPFAYFSAKDILAKSSIDTTYAYMCIMASLIALSASYLAYTRRDFKI